MPTKDGSRTTGTHKTSSKEYMKELAEKLLAAEKLNDALINSIGDGVIVVDEYGVIQEVNGSALRMLGYDRKDMLGEWLQKALPSKDKEGKDIPPIDRPAVRSLVSGRPFTGINTYVRKDGSNFPVSGTAAPFIIDGKPKGSIIVFRDVSRDMAVEKAKDEFVSLASHQLRTPLTSIRMYAQMLRAEEKGLSGEHKHYIRKIEGATISMLELVDDFLSVSKLELGKLELNSQPVDLTQLIAEQIGKLQNIADDNGIVITYRSRAKSPITKTDGRLLSEVLYNLLTNAIRYRRPDRPRISITLTDKADDLVLAVKDNGIGIPEGVRDKVFERLYRADNAKESHSEGTGLGLYLVHKIMQALGGRITFKSRLSEGTTFFVHIPKRAA